MIDQSLAMAPGQGHWGNCNSTGTLGQQEQWQWGNGTVIIAIAIDRSCVCVDVGRQHDRLLIRVLIQNVSECQLEVRIKVVTYLFDYFD
jgi:hypothetical protein